MIIIVLIFLYQEIARGSRPPSYEVFVKTHGLIDDETGIAKWTNDKAKKIHVMREFIFAIL